MSQKIKKVAVIGTGLLGTQISMLSAYAGYKVSVYDTIAGAFDGTFKKLSADFKAKEINPFIPWEHWEKCRAAINFTTSTSSTAPCTSQSGAAAILTTSIWNVRA